MNEFAGGLAERSAGFIQTPTVHVLSRSCAWLDDKSLKTKDAVRLALRGLGTAGRLLGRSLYVRSFKYC